MLDIAGALAIGAMFLLSMLYVHGCEKLKGGRP
jgi:hypothetical protein